MGRRVVYVNKQTVAVVLVHIFLKVNRCQKEMKKSEPSRIGIWKFKKKRKV